MKNKNLITARKNKRDEFYTQLEDIERELKHYNKENFKNKVVFCNCDNPLVSNFYKYFADNFKNLELKKLISSCYIENGKGFYYEYNGFNKKYPTIEDVTFFNGDGDFRSEESCNLLKKADLVITNPPFSLFREYLSLVNENNKKFLIIGNINSITYKETFKLIEENNVWLGVNMGRGISGFIVPSHYELYGTETKTNEDNKQIVSPNNCLWLTNLKNNKRNEYIKLTKTYLGNEEDYPKYDNYNGINVNKTLDIPSDYDGTIGVPITFLHKHNPNQFEIVKFRKGDDGKDLSVNGKSTYCRILIKHKK